MLTEAQKLLLVWWAKTYYPLPFPQKLTSKQLQEHYLWVSQNETVGKEGKKGQ